MESDTPAISSWLPALLQCADPLFPTGAYAHSFGLEEMVRLGVVGNEGELGAYLIEHLLPILEAFELPYLRFAIGCAENLEGLIDLDWEINAVKIAAESRSSSVQLGVRRLSTLRLNHTHPFLVSYENAVKDGLACGHHLCACAVQAMVLGTPVDAALLTYGYQSLAGACAAALKLLRVGQDACQRVLASAIAHLPDTVRLSQDIKREAAGCFSPMLEIAAMRHAFANERLFIS